MSFCYKIWLDTETSIVIGNMIHPPNGRTMTERKLDGKPNSNSFQQMLSPVRELTIPIQYPVLTKQLNESVSSHWVQDLTNLV